MERKLIALTESECQGGILPAGMGNVAHHNGPHKVLVKGYSDGSTVPLGCGYDEDVGDNVIHCNYYDTSELNEEEGELPLCRFFTKE